MLQCCRLLLPQPLLPGVASLCCPALCASVQQDHLDIRVIPSFQEVEKEDRNGEKHTMTAVKLQASMFTGGRAGGLGHECDPYAASRGLPISPPSVLVVQGMRVSAAHIATR